MIRRFLFRVIMVLSLIISPVLFPAILLRYEKRLRWSDLREMYVWVWALTVRGYL